MGQINLSGMLLNMKTTPIETTGRHKLGKTDAFSDTFAKVNTAHQARNKQTSTVPEKTLEKKEQQQPVQEVQKEKVDDQKKPIEKESSKEIEEELSKAQEKEVADEIVTLVSQSLGLSTEEIQAILQKLGLGAEDLLGEQGFASFIEQALGQGEMMTLLTGEMEMKKIRELLEGMKQLSSKSLRANEGAIAPESILQVKLEVQEAAQNVSVGMTMEQGSGDIQQEGGLDHLESIHQVKLTDQAGFEGKHGWGEAGEQSGNGLLQQGTSQNGDLASSALLTKTFTQTIHQAEGFVTKTMVTRQAGGGQVVLEQVDYKVLAQTKELNVQLSPKELGTMNIRIVESNGALVAEIKVEDEKTKAFIQSEIAGLKENLEEQGLSVTDVHVDVRQGNGQSQMEQGRQKSSRRIQEIISTQYEEEQVEEDEKLTLQAGNGSEVDYMI